MKVKRIAAAVATAAALGLLNLTGSEAQAANPKSLAPSSGGTTVQIGYRGGYWGYPGIRSHTYRFGHRYHGHGRGHYDWYDTSHYDWHPGHYRRHGSHYHYMPGHYDFHRDGHWDYHRGHHRPHRHHHRH